MFSVARGTCLRRASFPQSQSMYSTKTGDKVKSYLYEITWSSGCRWTGGVASKKLIYIPSRKSVITKDGGEFSVIPVKDVSYKYALVKKKKFHLENLNREVSETRTIKRLGVNELSVDVIDKIMSLNSDISNLITIDKIIFQKQRELDSIVKKILYEVE